MLESVSVLYTFLADEIGYVPDKPNDKHKEITVKVKIKSFDVNMDVKSKGIEFEVRTKDDSSQIGDCYLTMTGLTWCQGKIEKKNGINITWQELQDILKTSESKKAALQAVNPKKKT